MKLQIPCPHHPKCQIRHTAEVEISLVPICGLVDCDKPATNILELEPLFFKVCLTHYKLYATKFQNLLVLKPSKDDFPSMPLEMHGKGVSER